MAWITPQLWPEPRGGQGLHRLRGQVLPDDLDQPGLDLIGQPVPQPHDEGKVWVRCGKGVGKSILMCLFPVAVMGVTAKREWSENPNTPRGMCDTNLPPFGSFESLPMPCWSRSGVGRRR